MFFFYVVNQCTNKNIVFHFLHRVFHTKPVNFLFIDPPTRTSLRSSLSNTTVLNGKGVTFNCTTDAYPAASYMLYNKRRLFESNSSGIFSTNITEGGNYTCTAVNAVGTGQSAAIAIALVGEPPHDNIRRRIVDLSLLAYCNDSGTFLSC